MRIQTPLSRTVILGTSILLLAVVGIVGWTLSRFERPAQIASAVLSRLGPDSDSLPDQRQSSERLQQIRDLEAQRKGSAVIKRSFVEQPPAVDDSAIYTFEIASPAGEVEDTDIRGYLDGAVRYDFNQGTSYHMRVGRRYESPYQGRYELKRSLVRWKIPDLPDGVHVSSARIQLWIEAFYFSSPLSDPEWFRPLHLFAYPLDAPWNGGLGGIERDDFSEPSRGEASWNYARYKELEWEAPGALVPGTGESAYVVDPLAVGTIRDSNVPIDLSSRSLDAHVQELIAEGDSTLSMLLKLEDGEEGLPGTEMAFLSSDFGDPRAPGQRPTLQLEVVSPHPSSVSTVEFVMEAGTEQVYPPSRHEGSTVILDVEVGETNEHVVPVEVFVRGGLDGAPQSMTSWEPLTNPIIRHWDWSQVKLSSKYNQLAWGDTFHVDLKETWVQPGPRDAQVPELIAIAPSGTLHRVVGRPIKDLRYDVSLVPDEMGLWRYGWSFRPTRQRRPGSHVGEGLVFVRIPPGPLEEERLADLADHIIESVSPEAARSDHVQVNVNALVRALRQAVYGERIDSTTANEILGRVEEALTSS